MNTIQNTTLHQITTKVGTPLSEAQKGQLEAYANLLIKWNKAINLIGRSTESEVWERHILDSAQVVPHLPTHGKILDFGSGGGLPSVIMAILLPEAEITACEKVQKKCDFLNTVRVQLGLKNFTVESCQVQALLERGEMYAAVTARAVSELQNLLEWTEGILSKNGRYVFLKGVSASREISDVSEKYSMTITRLPSMISSIGGEQGEILILES